MTLADELFNNLVKLALVEDDQSFIDELIQNAKAAILNKDGTVSSLLNSSVNGKSFGKAVYLNPVQVLSTALRAKYYLQTGSDSGESFSAADFSRIVL